MNDIVVLAVGITKLLKGLNPSKALGPDELHPRVLKELAHSLKKEIGLWLAINQRVISLTCVTCKLLGHSML